MTGEEWLKIQQALGMKWAEREMERTERHRALRNARFRRRAIDVAIWCLVVAAIAAAIWIVTGGCG